MLRSGLRMSRTGFARPPPLERVHCVNGAAASRTEPGTGRRRLALDAALLVGLGLVMAGLGPYRTLDVPDPLRIAYWILAVTGAGLIGILIDEAVGPRIRG